jgi:hypothetical protein
MTVSMPVVSSCALLLLSLLGWEAKSISSSDTAPELTEAAFFSVSLGGLILILLPTNWSETL